MKTTHDQLRVERKDSKKNAIKDNPAIYQKHNFIHRYNNNLISKRLLRSALISTMYIHWILRLQNYSFLSNIIWQVSTVPPDLKQRGDKQHKWSSKHQNSQRFRLSNLEWPNEVRKHFRLADRLPAVVISEHGAYLTRVLPGRNVDNMLTFIVQSPCIVGSWTLEEHIDFRNKV